MKKHNYTRKSVPQGIAEVLAKEITAHHRPGDALETVQVLASRFEVSVATIRNALLILSKDGIVESIHGSGTYVREAQPLRHVAVLTQMDAANFHKLYFFWRVIQFVNDELEKKGIPSRCYTGYGRAGVHAPSKLSLDFLHSLHKNMLTGVVCVGVDEQSHLPDVCERQGVPIVGMHGSAFQVAIDFEGMIRAGLKELAVQGKKRVALFANQLASPDLTAFIQQEAELLGMESRREWIHTDLIASRNSGGWASFKSMWSGFGVKPDGIVCLDDILFSDIFMALIELGIQVPSQLSVVTHANRGSGLHYPIPVTFLEFDPDIHGKMLTASLLDLMRGVAPQAAFSAMPFEVIRDRSLKSLHSPALA